MVELSHAQAVRRARRRMVSNRLPIGVAVRRTWLDGPDDGIRAEILIVDGSRVTQPGSVLVFRAREWINADAVESLLESHALRYPSTADRLRELAHDVAEGSPLLTPALEQVWLDSLAA